MIMIIHNPDLSTKESPASLHVLIVEDSLDDAELMMVLLQKDGLQVDWQRVETAADFLASLKSAPDIILSDWTLPQFSGSHALKLLKESGLDIPFIIVSGSIGEEAAVFAIRNGAYDYLIKDRPERLAQAVRNALDHIKLEKGRKQALQKLYKSEERFRQVADYAGEWIWEVDAEGLYTYCSPIIERILGYTPNELVGKLHFYDLFEASVREELKNAALSAFAGKGSFNNFTNENTAKDGRSIILETSGTPILDEDGTLLGYRGTDTDITERKKSEEALKKSAEDLREAYDATLQGWSNALELRESATAGHSQRVVLLSLEIAKVLKFNEVELANIQRGALLHDIGKMGIPDIILLKPGPLTEDEWGIMRQHPLLAYQMLSKIPYLTPSLDIPHYHHEKWDGTGYPHGLKGEEIPIAARIFAVVDVWDALTSDRPYRVAWSNKKALDYIKTQSGFHFDPRIVEIFVEILKSNSI
jgi:PAS domain S-box-containing protein